MMEDLEQVVRHDEQPSEAIDHDDPRELIRGIVDRVRWTDERLAAIMGVMRVWIDADQKEGGKQ